jgi:hypothetical protein
MVPEMPVSVAVSVSVRPGNTSEVSGLIESAGAPPDVVEAVPEVVDPEEVDVTEAPEVVAPDDEAAVPEVPEAPEVVPLEPPPQASAGRTSAKASNFFIGGNVSWGADCAQTSLSHQGMG